MLCSSRSLPGGDFQRTWQGAILPSRREEISLDRAGLLDGPTHMAVFAFARPTLPMVPNSPDADTPKISHPRCREGFVIFREGPVSLACYDC